MAISFHWNVVKSNWIFSQPFQRLDAAFYSKDIIEARIILSKIRKNNIFEVTTLSDPYFVSRIFRPKRFKRKYTTGKNGKPFLMPKEVFHFSVKPRKFVLGAPEDLQIKEKWILVTRSGSIGRCLIVNKALLDYVISDDLIRIVLKDEKYLGYVYAFLNTWIGQAFLKNTPYGETVKHVEPEHIADIPLPVLSESDIKEINGEILNAHMLRDKAQDLLINAENLFYEELDLPVLKEESINYFSKEKSARAFILESQQIFLKIFRLNAFSYLPMCLHAESFLKKGGREGKFKLEKLKDVSNKIFTPPRFRRIYVKDPSEGIPLLQGSHIPMVKYFDLKNISKKMEKLDEYIIRKNWILVTCSGTIGRVFLTPKFCDGWTATNHMTRIIPSNEINAGYLTCFLQSLYGFSQLQALIYGGVVEEIGEAGKLLGDILVPIPPLSLQEKIGKLVTEAYEKKDQANMLENKAIRTLEEKLMEIAE